MLFLLQPNAPSEPNRIESSINTVLAGVSSFYSFHHQLGNTDITLIELTNVPTRRYKPLLHHISKSKPTKARMIKLKKPKTLPKTLTSNQIISLINSCQNLRDQFLIALLYESGLRIGQALSLRHYDIKSWDNEIHIQPRNFNENNARSKTRSTYIVHVTPKLMSLYTRYVLEECEEIKADYVFVQTLKKFSPGKPLNYRAVYDLFSSLSNKVGFHVTPHMLRHTHATELFHNGWDCSMSKNDWVIQVFKQL